MFTSGSEAVVKDWGSIYDLGNDGTCLTSSISSDPAAFLFSLWPKLALVEERDCLGKDVKKDMPGCPPVVSAIHEVRLPSLMFYFLLNLNLSSFFFCISGNAAEDRLADKGVFAWLTCYGRYSFGFILSPTQAPFVSPPPNSSLNSHGKMLFLCFSFSRLHFCIRSVHTPPTLFFFFFSIFPFNPPPLPAALTHTVTWHWMPGRMML